MYPVLNYWFSCDSQQTQCNGDYLEIRDGDSVDSPLIERLCGKLDKSRSEITSSGTNILLHFVSDNVNDTFMDRGFILQHIGGSNSSN